MRVEPKRWTSFAPRDRSQIDPHVIAKAPASPVRLVGKRFLMRMSSAERGPSEPVILIRQEPTRTTFTAWTRRREF